MFFCRMFFILCTLWVGAVNADGLPSSEQDFNLATDELLIQYNKIQQYHHARRKNADALAVNELSSQWGAPTAYRRQKSNLAEKLLLGVSTLVFTLPNPLGALAISGGLIGWSALQRHDETLMWEKGDYQIAVNTRRTQGRLLVDTWQWKYRGLGDPVPLIDQRQQSRNYFLLGYSKGLASLQNGRASYANEQYFLLAHRLHKASTVSVYMESGLNWSLPGKATPQYAQWVRIPMHLLVEKSLHSGLRTGLGAGIQIIKEYSNPMDPGSRMQNNKQLFMFVERKLPAGLNLGIRIAHNQLPLDQRTLNIPSLSSYLGIRF